MALSDFLSHYQPKKQPAYDADLTLYVAKNGDDAGKGTKEEPFVIQSALPEYQVLWLSRLLPEGKRHAETGAQGL